MTTAFRLVLTCALVALTGCITDPVTGQTVFGRPMSDMEEDELGEQYKPQILAEFSGAYPDEELQAYLAPIVLGFAKSGARPDLSWSFTVLNTSEVNAFAIPGGEVFMTRGLLWRLDDEAEFAVVMGHEVGHVEHRHGMQSMVRDTGAAAIIQAAAQYAGVESVAGTAQTLLLTRFSRDQERESDVRGVHHAYQAGYDPRRGAEVFRKFLALKGGQESFLDAWTASHPLDTERIENIHRLSAETDQRLAGTGPVEGLKVDVPKFDQLVARLREAQKVYDRHDAAIASASKSGGKDAVARIIPELKACAEALPSHAYFANSLGRAYVIAGDMENGEKWLKRASGLKQGLVQPDLVLGQLAVRREDWNAAMTYAENGLAMLPGNYSSLYVRGEANLGLGRMDAARADFEAVAQTAPPDSNQYKAAMSRLGQAPAGSPPDVAPPPQTKKLKR
jgi:predicted Zn-dependent protease